MKPRASGKTQDNAAPTRRSAMRLWQSVSLCDDEHPKAALRYDAPNPRTAPANFFSVQLLHRNGAFSRIFDLEGPQPYNKSVAAVRTRAGHFHSQELPEKWRSSSSAAAIAILFQRTAYRVVE